MNQLSRLLHVRFDLWEIALVGALIALGLRVAFPERPGTATDFEIEAFAAKYGPERQTEHEEEWMIRDFFQDRRGGFFVDIGANHHKQYSKTWYLETALGWSGIAVDALAEFAPGFKEFRPRTAFFTFYVSDKSDAAARVFVINKNTTVASGDEAFVRQFGTPDRVDTVPTITLNDLFAAEEVTTIDFLSMDIELNEPAALRGLNLQRFRPALVCIEALLPVRQQILEYFARNGYIVEGRYLRADRENLYFRPFSADSLAP